MIFGRPDYQDRIVECDMKALRELFNEVLAAIPSDNGTADEEIRDFNYRFDNCFDGKIPKDEPVLLLRAQDILAHGKPVDADPKCSACGGDGVIRHWVHGMSASAEIGGGFTATGPCPACGGSGVKQNP